METNIDQECYHVQALAAYYMILSVRSLGHPRAKYGKGVMVGAAFFIALHLCNIAAQARHSLICFFSITCHISAYSGTLACQVREHSCNYTTGVASYNLHSYRFIDHMVTHKGCTTWPYVSNLPWSLASSTML
jgi:hypothetical protein